MLIYNFWYKKEIKAKNLNCALRKEKKQKLIFDSVVQKDEPEVKAGADAIGFNYNPPDDEE